jgi:adenylate kinase family enzyme
MQLFSARRSMASTVGKRIREEMNNSTIFISLGSSQIINQFENIKKKVKKSDKVDKLQGIVLFSQFYRNKSVEKIGKI